MTTPARLITIVCTLLATAVLAAPAASATAVIIEPGERIDYINSDGGKNQFCTLGHVYNGADLHVYAVTAGHCRNSASGYVRTERSGQTGIFVRSSVEPPRGGGPDYGLIDFGTDPLAGAYIGDIRTISTSHPEPQIGQTVCRSGISSGTHCGTIVDRHGAEQYLTTGMPPSIPGDSGAPVWARTGNRPAEIIGIWLGEKITAVDHAEYGRFASLAEGLRVLAAN
ncbi:serine protease [Mycobacterium sp.]|uniref:serine protease n=1 Tax=Mycobacterium sp. TaxID=1785 RepID=UPI000CBDDD4B|nr:serine protease [Mycobacterium sp.]PJE04754.1 MAG: serine protease [Mycobacterium sp.]